MGKIIAICIFGATLLNASIFSDAIASYQNKEYDKAYTLFHRALNNQSSIQANYFLGLMNLRGLGTRKNIEIAKRHLSIAASIGNSRAKCLLGEVHLLQNNEAQATKILTDAALSNVIECQQIKQKYNID
ncbi:MAG: hypothetical protein ACQESH_04300 [Campylobacterota bacterium]